MEKMSELISELRDNCQKLQSELLDSRNNLQQQQESTKCKPRGTSNVGVQVAILPGGQKNSSQDSYIILLIIQLVVIFFK